eukprot:UN15311
MFIINANFSLIMCSFHFESRRSCFQYCGFNDKLTKIISLGEVVFPDCQIGRFEEGEFLGGV